MNANARIAQKKLANPVSFVFKPNETFGALPDSLAFLVARCHLSSPFLSEHVATSNIGAGGE